ncbi:hypothetical protein MTR_7g082725 [Medicago truncatula]|uniref:Uncharacterized protein n=1 Tax=Medicago truncatula TaxID=3880 RepID=A0A072U1B1_MEDTR|nr:hypothetical protein MTR_7g082725 [Medicago truncatula]
MQIIRMRSPRRDWKIRTRGALNTDNKFGVKRIPKARQVSKGYSGDAFEARLIF